MVTQAMSLILLCFSYILNNLSTDKCHLLAALITYVKIHSKNNTLDQKIYIPVEYKDVHCIYTEGRNIIYAKLLCPTIHVDAYGYARTSLYDIIWDFFFLIQNMFKLRFFYTFSCFMVVHLKEIFFCPM